jgi:hypothetical protein
MEIAVHSEAVFLFVPSSDGPVIIKFSFCLHLALEKFIENETGMSKKQFAG